MTDQTESLILEILKRIQADVADMKADLKELKLRTTIVKGHLAGVMASLGIMNDRMDRFDTRLERIERRLDLVGAH
jgi:hypothetical protein